MSCGARIDGDPSGTQQRTEAVLADALALNAAGTEEPAPYAMTR